MIEFTPKTFKLVASAVKNKQNNFMNILSKKPDGGTELSRILLGNTNSERNQVVNILKGMIPQDCGKKFCTFY